jgi:Inosine-uridine preferring nucleoside hydrolase
MSASISAGGEILLSWPRGAATPIPVILDTDIGPDCDDAATVAVLHALNLLGEAKILGMMCNTTSPWGAPCLDAINTYYGRPDIPVGTLKGPGNPGGSQFWYGESFNRYVAENYPNRIQHGSNAPDAVALYRQLLTQADDHTVAIVSIGNLTVLRDLLISPPDAHSHLLGSELVAQKVQVLSVMGGDYPTGHESNFLCDPPATKQVVHEWPSPNLFSGFRLGDAYHTGPRLMTEAAADNPVRVAYERWDRYFRERWEPYVEGKIYPHSSFDQTSGLYAIRGLRNYWTAHVEGTNHVFDDGSNEWRTTPNNAHGYLIQAMPAPELVKIIEDLMLMARHRARSV